MRVRVRTACSLATAAPSFCDDPRGAAFAVPRAMKKVGVFYATREGQARKVADRIGGALIARDLEVAIHDVKDADAPDALALCVAVVLVASVHTGEHEQEMIDFVNEHPRVRELPSAFVSVCLTEITVEDPGQPLAVRAAAAKKVHQQVHAFLDKAHWHPAHVHPVAGALLYTHYNVLVRFVMSRIAKASGMPTDTSHDYEFTDWGSVDDFALRLARELTTGEAA